MKQLLGFLFCLAWAPLSAQVTLGGEPYGFTLELTGEWDTYEDDMYPAHPTCGYTYVAYPVEEDGSYFLSCRAGANDAQTVTEQFQVSEEIMGLCADGECDFSEDKPRKVKLNGRSVWLWTWTLFDGETHYLETEYIWQQGDHWVQFGVECPTDNLECRTKAMLANLKWLK